MPYFCQNSTTGKPYHPSCYKMHEMSFSEAMLLYDLYVEDYARCKTIHDKLAATRTSTRTEMLLGEMPTFQRNYETDRIGVTGYIPDNQFQLCFRIEDVKRYLKRLNTGLTIFNNAVYRLESGKKAFVMICPLSDVDAIHPSSYLILDTGEDGKPTLTYRIRGFSREKRTDFSRKNIDFILNAFTSDIRVITPDLVNSSTITSGMIASHYSFNIITDREFAQKVQNIKDSLSYIEKEDQDKDLRSIGLYDDYDLYLNIVRNARDCMRIYFDSIDCEKPDFETMLFDIAQLLYPNLSMMELAEKKSDLKKIFGFAKGDYVTKYDRYVDPFHDEDTLKAVYGKECLCPLLETHRYNKGERNILFDTITEDYGLPL